MLPFCFRVVRVLRKEALCLPSRHRGGETRHPWNDHPQNYHDRNDDARIWRRCLYEYENSRSLDQLVPAYLDAVPLDIMTGEPIQYKLKDDGTIAIYSIGRNGTDEGGDPRRNSKRGEWVWQYTLPESASEETYFEDPEEGNGASDDR